MNPKILGDKRKSNFDDNLADVVNEIYDKIPEVHEKLVVENKNLSEQVYDLDYFLGLDIEPEAWSDDIGIGDLLNFNESQNRLVRAGYERHLSFQEQIGLYLLYLENKLPAHLVKIVENMKDHDYEWTNQAYTLCVDVNGKQSLFVCQGLTCLDFDGSNYVKHSLKMSESKYFVLCKDLVEGANSLKKIQKDNPVLVKFFFTRKFEDLPERIQEKNSIWIPTPGEIVPIKRGVVINIFDVDGHVEGENRKSTSRGVRVINRDAQELNELANQMQSGELKTNMGE